ncbi:G2-specific serine/threonine protein kinase [Ascosphaera acerosa]|nr:G2-specific serine/threonine protein kinase [Ascosphaera acerosa]
MSAAATSSVAAEADKYEVLEQIGKLPCSRILCRKEIAYLKMSHKEREQLMSEFNILSSLRHPNIVAYYHREHLKSSQELYLYMEYCGGGDLGRVIRNLKASNKYAEEEFVWRILSQLVTALYRCHYGVNPPDAGVNVLGPSSSSSASSKPAGLKSKQAQVMILHRDLKPDNIFLGEDQSVKLGDFGLSKLLRSQDFASTYVGTPFYMSPEICAGEKYTLYSDVWAVGCIMYELCAKEPPFNARTHIQLIHKIREGRFPALPAIYSAELRGLIASCLKVNPQMRPDTAALLNNPVIRLMRKEMEVVDLGRALKSREDAAARSMREAERAMEEAEAAFAKLAKERVAMQAELEERLRSEWEAKARAEIEQQLRIEFEKLRERFDTEVQEQVAKELQKHLTESAFCSVPAPGGSVPGAGARPAGIAGTVGRTQPPVPPASLGPSSRSSTSMRQSCSTAASGISTIPDAEDMPSTTDLSDLSLDSPSPLNRSMSAIEAIQHTPFNSKQKMYITPPGENANAAAHEPGMSEPSPMKIDTIYRSPESKVIDFIHRRQKIHIPFSDETDDDDDGDDDDDDDDGIGEAPSPTRVNANRPRRQIARAKTMTSMTKLAMQQARTAGLQQKSARAPATAVSPLRSYAEAVATPAAAATGPATAPATVSAPVPASAAATMPGGMGHPSTAQSMPSHDHPSLPSQTARPQALASKPLAAPRQRASLPSQRSLADRTLKGNDMRKAAMMRRTLDASNKTRRDRTSGDRDQAPGRENSKPHGVDVSDADPLDARLLEPPAKWDNVPDEDKPSPFIKKQVILPVRPMR